MYDGRPGHGGGYQSLPVVPMQSMSERGGAGLFGGAADSAGCGPVGCAMLGDACLEPASQSTTVNWKYVGGGRGGYEKMVTMRYVGEGVGGYDREAPAGRCSCGAATLMLALLLAASAAVFLYFGGSDYLSGLDFDKVNAALESAGHDVSNALGFAPSSDASSELDEHEAVEREGRPEHFDFDCVVGAEGVADWGMDRRVYCCSKFSVECNAALPGHEHSAVSEDGGVEVTFDCTAGVASWASGWSEAKKRWCCQRDGVGCSPGHGAPAERDLSPTTRAPGLAAAPAAEGDCTGASDGWSSDKARWCCEHKDVGCSSPSSAAADEEEGAAYACHAGLTHWQTGWSAGKKQWCCEHEQLGCTGETAEAYDCVNGAARWETAWAGAKQKWCCINKGIACPTTTDAPAAAPTQQHAEYDCNAGFDSYREGWSVAKKVWCCENAGRACVEPALL